MYNSHIIDFIQGLSAIEIRNVEEHLLKSKALFEKEGLEGMELKLFKFLIANKDLAITDETIVSETGSKRVSDLKNNLFEKVLEAITSDKSIRNTELFDENETIFFTLKKRLLACRISIRLKNQKKIRAISELLDEIISKAKVYEMYEIIQEALSLKKYFTGIRLGQEEFDNIGKELEFYDYCQKSLKKAHDNYYRLILNAGFIKTLSNKEIKNGLSLSIKEMESDYKKTKSEQINYYIHILRFEYYEKEKNYKKAIDECNKLISVLKRSKAIYRKERMGFVHDNLSLYKTHLQNYSGAIKDAKHAQSFYFENSLNYAISKEQEFYAHFFQDDFNKANRCLIELLNHPTVDTGQFRKSKFVYYQACTLFQEKEFHSSVKLLNESLEIEKDKTRWNIALRILQIMIFIETNKIDQASSSLEALRKHVSRTEKTDEINERTSLIVKLLREIEKDGFEYCSSNIAAEKIMKQLHEKEGPTSWEHYSPELIKFHDWLAKRRKK